MTGDEYELRVREIALSEAVRWGGSGPVGPGSDVIVAAAEKFLAFLSPGESARMVVKFESPPEDDLVRWLRKAVRVRGGNVQVVLGRHSDAGGGTGR